MLLVTELTGSVTVSHGDVLAMVTVVVAVVVTVAVSTSRTKTAPRS